MLKSITATIGLISAIFLYQFHLNNEQGNNYPATSNLAAGSQSAHTIKTLIDDLNKLYNQKKVASPEKIKAIESKIGSLKQDLKLYQVKEVPSAKAELKMMDPMALCPEVNTIELINVAGFATTDELVKCGEPDTLAYVVFIEEPGDILGAQMTLSFESGMQYAGFELTHYGGTTISNLDPDPIKPKFLLEGITDAVFIAYIGVESTCDADINGLEYRVDLEYNFTFQDTFGNIQNCRQKAFPARVYNSTIKTPVLNFRSTPNTTISSLSQEYCTTIQISQDGIQAYLKELEFSVCNIDLDNDLTLTSTSVNGTPIANSYNSADSTLTLNIDDSYFPANPTPNPADNYFNENEKLNIQFCYQADDCPTENTQFITYKAAWGCNKDVCMSIAKAAEIRIRPAQRPYPNTTVEKLSNPGICGDAGIIELTMYAAETGTITAVQDSAAGLFTDITLGFETCDQSSLGVTTVNFGATSLPASSFSWDNGDLLIDLQTLTSDPDGPGGITDADGDGFYDDLPGGETLSLQVELEFLCELPPDPSSIACSSVDCSFAKFFVQAKRDCGQSFKIFPDIEEFNIINGATYVELKGQTLINNNFYGYDFGVVGNNSLCNPLAAKIRTIEFCYIYERENVEPCPGAATTNELQVVFAGSPIAVNDVQFVPGSGELAVNGVTTTTGATGVFTDIAIDKRVMNLPLGVPNVGDEICYKYQLVADTAICVPPQYMVGTHQVIETCDTGDCTCVTVKACDATEIRIDPTDCNCSCDIASGGTVTRYNLGYTDATMTEKIDRADVPLEDLSRFLPCDTILYEGWMKLLTPETVRDLYQLYFVANISNLGYSGWLADETELMIDASGSELVAVEFSKEGSSVRQNVDFSQFSDCIDKPGGGATGFWAYAAETPWDEVAHAPMCNSSYEHFDGNLFGIYLRNFDLLEDCRGNETAAWEESNCLQQFMDAFDVEVGDSIHMKWLLPLTKNVKAHARKEVDPTFTFAPPQILNVATGHYIDEFDDDCLVGLSNCRENTPFSTFCPNGVNAVTDMEVDDCGGTVEHEFNVIQSTPVNWYTKEYRPFFNMQDVIVPIHTPMMYCGNARLITDAGVEYPLEVAEYINHTCATVGTEEYCSVSSGDVGMLRFNLEENGYLGMGVGLGGITDGFRIEYDLCRVCPVELSDLSEYQIDYNYKICDPLDGTCFRCWVRADGTYVQMTEVCSRDGSTPVGHDQSYYDYFNADDLFLFAETSEDFNVTDVSNGFPALTQTVDRLLMASGSPGSSVEMNTIEICADGTDPSLETHKSVLGSVTVSNSLALDNVYDENMVAIPFNFVSSMGGNSTYAFPLEDLTPGDCVEIILGTTLLYCPVEPEVAEACLTVTSGCLGRDVLAAVVANASNCNTSTSCYKYVTEESDIQANFLSNGNEEYPLCGEIPVAALVKNVQTATVTDLALTFNLPLTGATIVPGSFMASYPNDGDLSGATPFYSISDPNVNGNILTFPEDSVFSSHIHSLGFPGVLSSLDSNFIVVKFLMKTDCDEFVSGSIATFEATAIDPCSPDILSTGEVTSDEFIIQNANPNDFAKILVTAKPSEAFCGQSDPEFTVTGLNISEKPSGDSLQMCITLPDELSYVPGSMYYAIPAGQSVGTETITMIGTQTQVCFAGYNNMPVGGQFTLKFRANFDEDTPCGDYKVGVDIKELRPQEICDDGGICDVFVQSSVNPDFTVTLKGPLETAELKLTRSCDGGDDPVTLCYEALLNNPGSDYSGIVTVNLHEDLNSNGSYDFFDPIIGTMDFPGTFVLADGSVTLTGCFEVPLAKSCPVILNVVYETECNCDNSVSPFTEIIPSFAVDLPSTIYLCPGEELALDTCSNYTIAFDPAANVVTHTTNDSLYIGLLDPSIATEMILTGIGGDCSTYEPFTIQGIEDLDLVLAESETCQNVPLTLELDLPSKYQDFVEVTWSPATNLDDPNILDPIFTSDVPGDYNYTVTMQISETCSIITEVTVTVLPNGTMDIGGEDLFCFDYQPATLNATAGYDYYEWYSLIGGFEIIQASTMTNTWSGPLTPGDYFVKGFRSTDPCPSVSGLHRVDSKECFDLELTKNVINVPSPFILGDKVTYEIVVCNINDPDIGMVFDATGIQVVDHLPGGVSYVNSSVTAGNYNPGTHEWDIPLIVSGLCDTLLIDVTVDEYDCIINDAEITEMDKEDIDSTPKNDDGDQSEDDEDNAKVQVDTFDLALTKMLNPMQTVPVTIGSGVKYDIEVCNQGTVDAYDVSVVDYVPAGMQIADPNWTPGSAPDEYFYTIIGPITAGNCMTVSITCEILSIPSSPATSYINHAEINGAKDANGNTPPDIDSTPDNDPGNDGPVTDDETMNANGDEDDHDPAEIPVIMLDCMISSNSFVCPGIPLMLEELGMGNVAWSWSGPAGFTANTKSVTIDPPVAGTYTVTVTDNNGLMTTCDILSGIHSEMSLSGVITNVSCKKASDGQIDLTVTGGTAPFTYDWSDDGPDEPDDDSEDLMGVEAGKYGVKVTDANGCELAIKFEISEPAELVCMAKGKDVLCFEGASGEISVEAEGGTEAYEYALDGGPYQSGNNFTSLTAGDYMLNVRDSQGCISACKVTLTEPKLLSCTVNITNDTSCPTDNGIIEVSGVDGAGGYAYSIDGGTIYQMAGLFSGLGEGDYILTVKDANGCTATCNASLTSPTLPACTIVEQTDISCKSFEDGALIAQGSLGSGDYEFSLDGSTWQSTGYFDSLAVGLYTVTIRNFATPSCISTCSVSLSEPEVIQCELNKTEVSCTAENDAIITVITTGGLDNFDYSIDNGSTWQLANTFSGLGAGSYTVTLRDGGDDLCFSTCAIVIAEPIPVSCLTTPTPVLCNGGDTGGVSIIASGGNTPYEYSLDSAPWQPGNVFLGLTAGNYTVLVRDENGCLTTCPVTITEPTALVCSSTKTDVTDCGVDNGTITISSSGGTPSYTYSLNGEPYQVSNSFSDLMPGTHTVSTKDANACTVVCEVVINSPNTPMCQITSVTHVECFGASTGQVVVTGSEGDPPYEFSIDNTNWQANGVFGNLPAGMHLIYIRNATSTSCISMCSVEIEEPEELQCLLLPNDPQCFEGSDGNITVIATEGTPGYEYSLDEGPWQPSHVFNNLTAGEYEVTIRDDNRCTITCSVTLGQPTELICNTVTVDLLCKADGTGMITVNGEGGTPDYDYNIDGGFWQDTNVFNDISAGEFTVYIRDINDCVSTCSAIVNEPPFLACELIELVPESCIFNDGSIEVISTGGTAPITYSIDGGTTTQATGLFEDLTLGTYTITIQDANGCVVTCDHDILPDCFDLALTKQLVTGGPYTYGQRVVFDINVINQGNVDATNVEVTDHVPCGFEYDPALLINQINDWTLLTTTFPMTEISSIPAGTTETIQIELIVKECTSANGHVNVTEISEAFDSDGNHGVDVDSDPDYDPTNDAGGEPNGPTDDQEDGDGTDDEDDQDPAFVPIYDVALEKALVTASPYSYGQLVEFAVEVCNQSSPTVTDVTITDHIPVGYSYAATDNPGWSGLGAPTPADVTYTIAGPLAGGDCISVPIFLTVEMAGGLEDWKNVVEVSEIKDEEGDPVDDVDSDEDNDDGDQSEDDEDAADLEVVDAALVKTTTNTGPFRYGDQVTFDIEVFNQGNVFLHNVVLNDFLPCGFAYLGVNSPLWNFDSGSNFANTTIVGPIAPGASEVVSIILEVQPCSAAPDAAWTNISEIESFENENGEDITEDDIDSDADDDPTNDTTEDNVNDNTNDDEDDNDPETIEVFDLAQIKEVVTASPYAYGDLLEYKIILINQGNVAATDVVLTDHLPAGLSFDGANNIGWDATNAPAYDYTVAGPVLSGDTVCVPIFVTIEMTSGGTDNYTNTSEISSAADGEGNPTEDADSDPDDDPANDGDPNNDATDDPNEEDDHDPEVIDVVDLALVKTTAATGPFRYGDQVTFDIEVFNQGNVDAYDVVVNDFIPCGYNWLISNEPAWALAGSVATTQISGPIAAGDSMTISITLEVQACDSDPVASAQGAWENISEISSFKDEDGEDITEDDIDSDADNDPNNDPTEDNVNDNTNGDEDDNDPEEIEIFDLAQIKQIVTAASYKYGDTIEYSICVVNQGNVTATDITITDYLPEGLGFEVALNTGWAETAPDIIQHTIAGPLLRDDTICIPIFLTIDMTMGGGNDHTNISEISSANDEDGDPGEDADSTADDDPENDGDPDNDSYHDEEDDHDPADLMVVDAALVKTTRAVGPFSYGDEITFDIEVFNQGNIDLLNVVVNDFVPCGYEWLATNSPVWSYDAATGIARTTILGPIPAGESLIVSKALSIKPCDELDAWTNIAEIESFQDEEGEDITDEDVDSDADTDPNNDETENDVNDNTNGDEDDNDPETIDIYDLAQDKTIITEGPYAYGDTLEYNICVMNQGNVIANTITVTDYLPVGLNFIPSLNPGWDATNDPAITYAMAYPLLPQDSVCFSIFVSLERTSGGDDDYTNITEITEDDGDDTDSEEDDDPDNDPEEEDDHDDEIVEIFDLALLKRISNQMPSQGFTYGDDIMYDMVVYNQGNVAAYNVQVCDFIPAGYDYDGVVNPTWTSSGPAPTTVCTIIEGPILPGDSSVVMIQMQLMNLGANGTVDDYKNIAEIGSAENLDGEEPEDIDSDPDNDPDNDGDEKDDEVNGEEGDEDDHDPALPLFMDLAMKKTLAEDYGPVAPGDIITYNFTLFNQGTIDAYNIEVTDHAPPGLTLSATDGNGWSAATAPAYTNVIAGPLLTGDSIVIQIDMEVGAFIKTGDYKNIAEISDYEDENGDTPDDYDSTADDDPSNDGDMENDATEGENGDEDDSDYENLSTFDLALIKQVNTPGPYQTRDIIEFVISVVNQGNIPATDIEIADHVPIGFSFDPAINSIWDDSSAPTYYTIIEGPLMPFDTARVPIFLEIVYVEDGTDLDYVNVAEISGAKDIDGEPIDDIDSTPDSNPENDGDPIDDTFDDKDDEDDHDPAGIPSTGLLPPCIPSCDIACLGQLNLSLGEECQSIVSPSMLLANLDNACDDPVFANYFNIELKDAAGNLIPDGLITANLVGQLITYSISVIDEVEDNDGTCNNNCWGNILVESKFAPVLDCEASIDTISCIELAVFDGPPLSGSGTSGCFATDINIEILNEQILEVDPCEGDLIKKVIRQYQAVDVSGGRSNICNQELHITKLDPALIKIPVSTSISLACNEEVGAIGEDDIELGVVPFYCPLTGSGTAVDPIPLYPLSDNFCNIFIEYTDEVIIDQPCKKQILRTWEIRQWHCNDEDVISVPPQILTLIDEKPPVLLCPTDTMHVSTSGSECTAKVLLPEILASDSCNIVSQIDMSYIGGFLENQNGGEITDVPVGLNAVAYIGYDACGNSSSCQVHLNVIDNSPPVIICEKHTQVSITSTGGAHVPASVFDDGSYDDCGSVIISARRMDLSCQSSEQDSSSIIFGDVVAFCCADVGTTQMVALKVTDHSGRENQCMVEVTVVDKNPPAIVAPPDITVSCEFIFDDSDLSVFGSIANSELSREAIVIVADSVNIAGSPFDGLVVGGCGTVVVEEVDMGNVSSCGTGLIERTFSMTSNGNTVSDKQTITVVSPVAFDPDRIVWPRDTLFYDICAATDLHPDNLDAGVDRPTLEQGVCELVGTSITSEQIFSADSDGLGCVKVFRKWTVINWCDTDLVTGLPARWDSIQTIGLENRTAPTISACSDTAEVYTSFDANCNLVSVSLSAAAIDDCTAAEELSWTWSIDLNHDGLVDSTGIGNQVNAAFIPGTHQIVWYVEDLCGNVSAPCSQYFEITNEKAAPAICLDHIVTDLVLMDLDWDGVVETEMVVLWASDVVKEDSHPCGHALSYSFDQAGLQDSIIYGCGDVGFNSVMIYVTDLTNGAQSSCWSEIEVQDNNGKDICTGLVGGNATDAGVSGLIVTEEGGEIVSAEVAMQGSELPSNSTDLNGQYAFSNMPTGGDYTILPTKNINHMNGVSTLDLVLIQKHILGLELLDSPYKLIAADINKSNSISAADIVQLRRLILGESDDFESNDSWRFIDELHEFDSSINPWMTPFPESYDIDNLSSDMIVDFVGVKVGDVTSNAKGNELVTSEVRTSSDPLTFIGRIKQGGYYKVIEFSSAEFVKVNGFQTTIEYDADQYDFVKISKSTLDISNENIGTRYVSKGLLTLSWHNDEAIDAELQDVLFRLYFKPKTSGGKPIKLSSNSKITVQEAYLDGDVTDRVEIEMMEESDNGILIVDQNEPNPWRESTVIGFDIPDGGKVQVRLYDHTGKLIRSIQDTYGIGINEIVIGRDIISTPGIYLYEVQYKDQIEYKRMIVLD